MPKRIDRRPVWDGPESDKGNGGVTFSLLSKFLSCRERFRVRVVEGLKPKRQFNFRIEFGNCWHCAEEAVARGGDWLAAVRDYAAKLNAEYPMARTEIDKWRNVVEVQFPIYLDYWTDKGGTVHKPLLSEAVFRVPYKLPSGRVVYLRGKFDSVWLVGKDIYLFEHKTKGEIDPEAIRRQLTYDLQTMMYAIAYLQDDWAGYENESHYASGVPPHRFAGVIYNVVRRPLSGGKGTIVQKKPSKSNPAGESREAYYERLAQYIRDDPDSYFHRIQVEIGKHDIRRFRRETLDPILEQLCDWWRSVSTDSFIHEPHLADWCIAKHWRHPYGCANWIDENGYGDVDEYLESGSESGLERVDDLFPELS